MVFPFKGNLDLREIRAISVPSLNLFLVTLPDGRPDMGV